MQLYAKDKLGQVVFARMAIKQKDYYCPECASPVRIRGGLHRQLHFYHTDPERPCRQSGKTMAHLQVQLFLKKELPAAEIEVPFPAIKRIADVVWPQEKLIFEVQCSPITAEEVLARNADYRSVGFQVVWILHDKRYNQIRLTAAELVLRSSPCYFTNMNAEGIGFIYDQYDEWKRGRRVRRFAPLAVVMGMSNQIKPFQGLLPKGALLRLHRHPFYFTGDLLDRVYKNDLYVQQAIAAEIVKPAPLSWKQRLFLLWHHVVAKPYTIGFRLLLERVSR